MYGFGLCFATGFLVSFCSTFLLWSGQFTTFAILYSFGNIISLLATGFLIGFASQFRKMFDSTRLVATCVFLGSLVLTFISALALQSGILTLLLCLVQYLALIWYSLSYVPFGRDAVKGCFGNLGR